MSTQALSANLISSLNGSQTQHQSTAHGGPRRNAGRPPAHSTTAKPKPRPIRSIRKGKDDANLAVVTKGEEQANWRELIETISGVARTEKDVKTKLEAAGLHMEALSRISVLKRGKAYQAQPAEQQSTGELAQLLRGLMPGSIKRQRRGTPPISTSDSTSEQEPASTLAQPTEAPKTGRGDM